MPLRHAAGSAALIVTSQRRSQGLMAQFSYLPPKLSSFDPGAD